MICVICRGDSGAYRTCADHYACMARVESQRDRAEAERDRLKAELAGFKDRVQWWHNDPQSSIGQMIDLANDMLDAKTNDPYPMATDGSTLRSRAVESEPHIVSEPMDISTWYRRLQMAEGQLAEIKAFREAITEACGFNSCRPVAASVIVKQIIDQQQRADRAEGILKRLRAWLNTLDDGWRMKAWLDQQEGQKP